MVAIREMTLDDMPEILCRLQDVAAESGWSNTLEFNPEYIASHLATMIGAENFLVIGSDDVAGILIAGVSPAWYSPTLIASEKLVYVHPSMRKGGIAHKLLARYVEWAKEKGAVKVVIGNSVGIEPDKVRALYESAGFVAVGYIFEQVIGE